MGSIISACREVHAKTLRTLRTAEVRKESRTCGTLRIFAFDFALFALKNSARSSAMNFITAAKKFLH